MTRFVRNCSRNRKKIGLSLSCLLVGVLSIPIIGQDLVQNDLDPAIADELHYAEVLQTMGFPDYAEIVLGRIKDPAARGRLELIKIQGLLTMGKFDEVIAIIARKPNQSSSDVWAMKLALADAYYAWGKYPQAQGLYEGYFQAFSQGPSAEMKKFYLNSAYKYAQMLLLMGNEKRALDAYRYALLVLPKKEEETSYIRRQVLGEMAELSVKLAEKAKGDEQLKLFQGIDEILNEILWKQDLWFGKAIVMMAHVRMMKGETEKAMKLIDDYKPQLIMLDQALAAEAKEGDDLTHLSPMAEVRYLIGKIMQEEAEKLIASGADRNKAITLIVGEQQPGKKSKTSGALQHFVNVFYNYPKTKWAPEAGERMEYLISLVNDKFGMKINIPVSQAHKDKVKEIQFQNARTLYNQQQFKQAADAYIKLLNFYPEGEKALLILDDLTTCYIEEQDEIYADTTLMYMAECFSEDPALLSKAGDQLLRIAEDYRNMKLPEKTDWAYSLYFRYFKKHPRAAAILYRFGEEKFNQGDIENALAYFMDIKENYKDNPLHLDAISRIANCYSIQEKTDEEIIVLKEYIELLEKQRRPGQALINGQYRMAIAYRKLGPKFLPGAINRYTELIKLLQDKTKMDQYNPEEQEANKKILEGAMYQKAACYSLLQADDEPTARKYQLISIKLFEELLTLFPKTEYAPSSLSQIGTLWTVLGDANKAEDALTKLQKEYPESPEAKNATFMRAMSLLKLGRRQQAIRLFKEMIQSTDGKFTEAQILTAAAELLRAGEYELALEAYMRVLKAADQDPRLREPAMLGQGKALVLLGRHEQGAKALDDMLEQYPKSAYTVEACLFLSETYSELGRKEQNEQDRKLLFNRAINALKRVRKFVSTDGERAETDIRIARILYLKSQAEAEFGDVKKASDYRDEAIATYQMLVLLGDPNNKETAPHITTAFVECLPLLFEAGKFKNVIEDSDKFMEYFPSDRKYAGQVRKWRNKAERELSVSPDSAPGTGTSEAPATEPETAPAGQ
ncbi:MAG: tetratricopeptide repeat protein [Lentisphaerae bacterium]|nr:tetratricopeptide repeat protein [Lentisphaerota bacterium]